MTSCDNRRKFSCVIQLLPTGNKACISRNETVLEVETDWLCKLGENTDG